MPNLEREFNFYLRHQKEFVKKHNGKHIVLKDRKVVGVYKTDWDAFVESQKRHKLGTFLIQRVSPGQKDYTQIIYSPHVVRRAF